MIEAIEQFQLERAAKQRRSSSSFEDTNKAETSVVLCT